MSEKERQKKDGQDTNKKNQAARGRTEQSSQSSEARRKEDRPATYGEGLPRNDQPDSK